MAVEIVGKEYNIPKHSRKIITMVDKWQIQGEYCDVRDVNFVQNCMLTACK